MRQRISARKLRKYNRLTGLNAVVGLVRGNTNHRVDLCLPDGSVRSFWPKTGALEKDEGITWDQREQEEENE